jgi:hypothetical protein
MVEAIFFKVTIYSDNYFPTSFRTDIHDGESDTFLVISQIYSALAANFTPGYTGAVGSIYQYETTFNNQYDLNFTNQPFLTFADKFSPHVYKGDNYTALMRWNLTDPFTTIDESYGVGTEITGYGARANFTQPFKAENIILVSSTNL